MPTMKSIIPVDGRQQQQQQAIEQFVDVGLEPAVKVTVTTDEGTGRKGTCRQSAGRTNVQWQRRCRILLVPMWKVCSSAFSISTRYSRLSFLASNFPVKQIAFTKYLFWSHVKQFRGKLYNMVKSFHTYNYVLFYHSL